MKAISRSLSAEKQVIKFANTSNCDRVFLSSQNDRAILKVAKCTVQVSTSFTSLLLAVMTSTAAAALKKITRYNFLYLSDRRRCDRCDRCARWRVVSI